MRKPVQVHDLPVLAQLEEGEKKMFLDSMWSRFSGKARQLQALQL